MYTAAAIAHAAYGLGMSSMLTPEERRRVQQALSNGELTAGSFSEMVRKTGHFLGRVLKTVEAIAPVAAALLAAGSTHISTRSDYKLSASTVGRDLEVRSGSRLAVRVGPLNKKKALLKRTSKTTTVSKPDSALLQPTPQPDKAEARKPYHAPITAHKPRE